MNNYSQTEAKNRIVRIVLVIAGIFLNVILFTVMGMIGNPLYLDTPGTIGVTLILGPFYGIIVAVMTNLVSAFFYADSIFFSSVNAIIAIYSARFIRKRHYLKISGVVKYVLSIAVAAGVLSSLIQIAITGENANSLINEGARIFALATDLPYVAAVIISSIFMNIFDKGISCCIAAVCLRFIPKEVKESAADRRWVHYSIYHSDDKDMPAKSADIRHSVRTRTTITMIFSSVVIVFFVGWVTVRMYFNYEKNTRTREAQGAAGLAAGIIDPERIDTYIREGRAAPGYEETEDKIKKIYNSAEKVAYLYVIQARNGAYHAVFDVEGAVGSPPPYQIGEIVEFADGFDEYLAGVDKTGFSEPIETDDEWGHLLTVACPIRTTTGITTAFVIADVSVNDLMNFVWEFVIKTTLIMAGVLILIIALELWITEVFTVRPISGLVECVGRLASSVDDQDALDDNVRKIRALDIRTGDEIEKLYTTMCDMTLDQAEQMRSIRHLSDSTAVMQDGLIMTMADLVESRDSDTGAHVQKTAAYVKIIAEGLKKKGYYVEKLSPKFMSDIVRSAPLHDVGKINIPDGILNQARKLTDEEYEIMKTHTTAGKQIIEKAINTVQGGMYLKEARNMAAYHHERWDGKGYPEGLHGEVIPLSARIMAVADVFDALTSPRVYKEAYSLEKALEIIKEGSGTQFDPKCVEVFEESISEVKVIHKKYSRES